MVASIHDALQAQHGPRRADRPDRRGHRGAVRRGVQGHQEPQPRVPRAGPQHADQRGGDRRHRQRPGPERDWSPSARSCSATSWFSPPTSSSTTRPNSATCTTIRFDLRLVVRTPMGGKRGYGATHSQCLEKHFLGLPDTRMIALHHRHDPGRIYDTLFADVDRPTIVIENKLLYGMRAARPAPEGFVLEHRRAVPDHPDSPRRSARPDDRLLRRDARSTSRRRSTRSSMITRSPPRSSARRSSTRSITGPIVESLRKSGRLLIVEEGQGFRRLRGRGCGPGRGASPGALKALRRLASPEHPIPSCGPLEKRSCRGRAMSSPPSGGSAIMAKPAHRRPARERQRRVRHAGALAGRRRRPVESGQSMAQIETSKTVVEIEAAAAGTLRHEAKEGQDVPIGEAIGLIGGAAAAVPASSPVERPAASIAPTLGTADQSPPASPGPRPPPGRRGER